MDIIEGALRVKRGDVYPAPLSRGHSFLYRDPAPMNDLACGYVGICQFDIHTLYRPARSVDNYYCPLKPKVLS